MRLVCALLRDLRQEDKWALFDKLEADTWFSSDDFSETYAYSKSKSAFIPCKKSRCWGGCCLRGGWGCVCVGGADELTILQFRRRLAWELINNPLLTEQRPDWIATRRRTNPLVVHNVAKCPPFTLHWNDPMFEITSQFRYNQFTCKSRGCKKRVKTYCVCTPGEWLCSLHWCAHLLEAAAIWFVGNWYQSL